MLNAGSIFVGGLGLSCGGPWGTAGVVGVAGLVGGLVGNKAGDIVIEEFLR